MKKVQKKDVIIKFIPIIFIVIMLCLGSLTIYLWVVSDKSLIWTLYIILKIFGWGILAVLMKNLYIASYKDQLTNLWNNRYLNLKLKSEVKKIKHNRNTCLTIAILDIDGFKDVNDKYGHLEGDKILVGLASMLTDNVRQTDTVVRWAGDEFIIILPNTNKNDARKILERIKNKIEEHSFKYKITVSCGLICIRNYIQLSDLIMRADKALYKAKKTKNTIVAYEI